MSKASVYVRSNAGRTIHRRDCRRAGRIAVDWNWPDPEWSEADLRRALQSFPWLACCSHCLPEAAAVDRA